MTWRLIPFLFLCYVMAFLDRINVGYAQLQVKQDLGLSDAAYGLGASVFFIGYVLFEVPSNVTLTRIGARKTLSRIMFLWGLASAAMMFAAGYAVTFWLPTIIKGFGVADIMHIGLYSMLPYLLGGVAMLWWGYHSDRTLERRWHFAIGAGVAAVGFFMVPLTAGNFVLSMLSISIAFAGVVAILPIFWTVPPLLLSGAEAAVGLALINSLSAMGGVVAPWTIGVVKTATGSIDNALYVIAATLVAGGALMVLAVPARMLRERRED